MCVVAIALSAHPRWRLTLAANRDEFHARPTAALARWVEDDQVIAGRDLQSGGTWLGVSEAGRIALVTNVRNPEGPQPDKASRGALVADWLTGEGEFADSTKADLTRFNPFNLLIADKRGAHFLTNQPQPNAHMLPPGLHSLSNGMAGEAWPRKDRLEAALSGWLSREGMHPEALLEMLRDETAMEAENPLFIRAPVYGTRCSTVIAIDAAGRGVITERRFDAEGVVAGETRLGFNWT